jgi:hypothetical protein
MLKSGRKKSNKSREESAEAGTMIFQILSTPNLSKKQITNIYTHRGHSSIRSRREFLKYNIMILL